jgi:hypothetical protein
MQTAVVTMLRRMTVSAAQGKGLWQLLGFEDERIDGVEGFHCPGCTARPKATSTLEVVMGLIGGAREHPVVLGCRDLVGDPNIEEDEAASAFTSQRIGIKSKADGTIELGLDRSDGDALGGTDGVVHGTGIDPFTGVSYALLGNTSDIVRAKKS